jgi:centrin-1
MSRVVKKEFNARRYEKNGLTEDEVLEIKEAFDLFDTDGSGTISTEELRKALQNLGIDARNQTLLNMMADLDKDKSGSIEFDEFISMMTAQMSDTDSREDLRKIYNLFIGDNSGSELITRFSSNF